MLLQDGTIVKDNKTSLTLSLSFAFYLLQIKWEYRLVVPQRCRVYVTVDGTDFRIKEPSPFSKSWYSHKYKGPGVQYEVAICIATGWIVWLRGPYRCGSWPDLSIAQDALHLYLDDGERYVADNGYNCQEALIPNDVQTFYEMYYMSTARSRHETVNQLFKQFRVIGNRFHRSVDLHGQFTFAIANIIQLGIMIGEVEPFDLSYFHQPPTWPSGTVVLP